VRHIMFVENRNGLLGGNGVEKGKAAGGDGLIDPGLSDYGGNGGGGRKTEGV